MRYCNVCEKKSVGDTVFLDFIGNEEFLEDVGRQFGSRGQRQAQAILSEARQLFAGGELSDEDQIAFLTEMQQLFLDSKQRAKKYTPRIYLREDGEE